MRIRIVWPEVHYDLLHTFGQIMIHRITPRRARRRVEQEDQLARARFGVGYTWQTPHFVCRQMRQVIQDNLGGVEEFRKGARKDECVPAPPFYPERIERQAKRDRMLHDNPFARGRYFGIEQTSGKDEIVAMDMFVCRDRHPPDHAECVAPGPLYAG